MSINEDGTPAGADGAEAAAADLDSLIAESAAEINPTEGIEADVDESDGNTEGEAEGAEATSEVATDDEDKFTVTIDGETVEVTLDEALKGYQRQADYTKKTQALAADRERYAAFDALDKAFAEDPVGTLRSLALSLGVTDLGVPATGEQAPVEDFDPDDPIAAKVMEMEQQLQQANAILQQQEAARRQEAIDREIETVKVKYEAPDLNETTLLRFALDNGITNLEMAYRAMVFGEQKAPADKPADKLAKKRAKPKVEGGGNRNVGVVPGSSDAPSLEEAWHLSWQEARAS